MNTRHHMAEILAELHAKRRRFVTANIMLCPRLDKDTLVLHWDDGTEWRISPQGTALEVEMGRAPSLAELEACGL